MLLSLLLHLYLTEGREFEILTPHPPPFHPRRGGHPKKQYACAMVRHVEIRTHICPLASLAMTMAVTRRHRLVCSDGIEMNFLQVKLVVVDSMAFHLRQGVQNMAHRTRLLAQLSQKMMQVASKHSLAASLPCSLPRLPMVLQGIEFCPVTGLLESGRMRSLICCNRF